MSGCQVAGCPNKPHRRKLCAKHYRRLRVHGDTSTVLAPGRKPVPPSAHVECGDCGLRIAIVSTNKAVWQALAAHQCPTKEKQ